MNKIYINNTKNYYREYFIDDEARPTIVISAGGGYKYTSPRESEPVQEAYNKNGYHVVIVNYREDTTEVYPTPSNHLAYVLRLLRNDKRVTKLIGIGFSAGGHNILEVALHPDLYKVSLDLLMLAYPVVTSDERYSHKGSFLELLKDKYNDDGLRKRVSLENEVTKNAPDLFLWTTFTDESVNVMNSLLLMQAYKKAECNLECHIFPMGGHGLSLATKETCANDENKIIPYIEDWLNMSLKWLNYKLSK